MGLSIKALLFLMAAGSMAAGSPVQSMGNSSQLHVYRIGGRGEEHGFSAIMDSLHSLQSQGNASYDRHLSSTCYEAYIPDRVCNDYSDCGYICVDNYCAVNNCACDCTTCATAYPDHVVDYTSGKCKPITSSFHSTRYTICRYDQVPITPIK